MGFRWRKSFKIAPGIRINLSNRSIRAQVGSSPLSFTAPIIGGSKTKRITASIPHTGLSFFHTFHPSTKKSKKKPEIEEKTPEEPSLMAELFLHAVHAQTQRAQPPISMKSLPRQGHRELRTLFKTAVYEMAIAAGHDPEKEPQLVMDALLFLDGESADGLRELARDCSRRWREAEQRPRAEWTISGDAIQPAPPPILVRDQQEPPKDAATLIGCSTMVILGIGVAIGLWIAR